MLVTWKHGAGYTRSSKSWEPMVWAPKTRAWRIYRQYIDREYCPGDATLMTGWYSSRTRGGSRTRLFIHQLDPHPGNGSVLPQIRFPPENHHRGSWSHFMTQNGGVIWMMTMSIWCSVQRTKIFSGTYYKVHTAGDLVWWFEVTGIELDDG